MPERIKTAVLPGMTLDANKLAVGQNVRAGASPCMATNYRIEDVECCNAPGVGFYSEWGFTSEVPVLAGGKPRWKPTYTG